MRSWLVVFGLVLGFGVYFGAKAKQQQPRVVGGVAAHGQVER